MPLFAKYLKCPGFEGYAKPARLPVSTQEKLDGTTAFSMASFVHVHAARLCSLRKRACTVLEMQHMQPGAWCLWDRLTQISSM